MCLPNDPLAWHAHSLLLHAYVDCGPKAHLPQSPLLCHFRGDDEEADAMEPPRLKAYL